MLFLEAMRATLLCCCYLETANRTHDFSALCLKARVSANLDVNGAICPVHRRSGALKIRASNSCGRPYAALISQTMEDHRSEMSVWKGACRFMR